MILSTLPRFSPILFTKYISLSLLAGMALVQICGEVCTAYAAEPGPHSAGGGARALGCRRPGILALPGTLHEYMDPAYILCYQFLKC